MAQILKILMFKYFATLIRKYERPHVSREPTGCLPSSQLLTSQLLMSLISFPIYTIKVSTGAFLHDSAP